MQHPSPGPATCTLDELIMKSQMQSSHMPPALSIPDTAQCLLGREQMPSKASTHRSDASSVSAARAETAAG